MKKALFISIVLLSFRSSAQSITDGMYLFPIEKDGKYGYINQKGEEVIHATYDAADYFYQGLAAVKLNGKYGFIDATDKLVIPAEYDSTRHFNEGLCAIAIYDKLMPPQWGYINRRGEVLQTDLPALGFASNFYEGRALIALNGMDEYRFIDKKGKIVMKPGEFYFYEDTEVHYSNGMLKVQKVTGIGMYFSEFVDTNGKVITKIPYQDYADIGNVHEGMMWFKKGEKFGYMDITGKEVLPADYDTAIDFSEGMARVSQQMEPDHLTNILTGGVHGYINSKGEMVIKPNSNMGYCFHDGYAKVYDSGKWGFMNTNGVLVIPAEYEDVKDFFRGLAYVKKGGLWGYINTKGEFVWQQSE